MEVPLKTSADIFLDDDHANGRTTAHKKGFNSPARRDYIGANEVFFGVYIR
jgi:hypothetical protein